MSGVIVATSSAGVISCFNSRVALDQWARANNYMRIPETLESNLPSGVFLMIPSTNNPSPAQTIVIHLDIQMYDAKSSVEAWTALVRGATSVGHRPRTRICDDNMISSGQKR